MKNQYFGDINDYLKYGLLRRLACGGEMKIVVCWMLTPDDNRRDGRRIAYLDTPDQWRSYDSKVFDTLRMAVHQQQRHVGIVEQTHLIPEAVYFGKTLTDNSSDRERYFSELHHRAYGDIIFFDPDNGMEVKSVPYGKRGSSKYLYWKEFSECYQKGLSVLFYQHFIRKNREQFISELSARAGTLAPGSQVIIFRTAHAFFLLAAQPNHLDVLLAQADRLAHPDVLTSRG
jgi:hypothetical protein